METVSEAFALNDRVKIDRENGYYWVVGYGKDTSVTLWGGDADPNGYRSYRSIKPDRLKADVRKLQKKAYPSFVFQEATAEDDV